MEIAVATRGHVSLNCSLSSIADPSCRISLYSFPSRGTGAPSRGVRCIPLPSLASFAMTLVAELPVECPPAQDSPAADLSRKRRLVDFVEKDDVTAAVKTSIKSLSRTPTIVHINAGMAESNDPQNSPATIPIPSEPRFGRAALRKLLQYPGMGLHYRIDAIATRLALAENAELGTNLFRWHPNTIADLHYFHQTMLKHDEPGGFEAELRKLGPQLISKLVQGSHVSLEALKAEVAGILFPCTSLYNVKPILSRNALHQIVGEVIQNVAEPRDYGLSKAGLHCLEWQVERAQEMLGATLATKISAWRAMRESGQELLDEAFQSLNYPSLTTNPHIPTVTDNSCSAASTAEIQAGSHMVPTDGLPSMSVSAKKDGENPGLSQASTPKTTRPKKQATVSNQKIHNFFAVLKRESPEPDSTASEEFFKPFFLRPNTSLAPANQFTNQDNLLLHSGMRIVKGATAKPMRLCLGLTKGPVAVIMKLLQFHSNYRPAYYGSWRQRSSSVGGRRPFTKEPVLDYENDSDDDWAEEDDEDGESIVSGEDDELEEELSSTMDSEDSWVVPHGYLSEDEGLEEGAAAEFTHKPESNDKRANGGRKFVPKDPIILGPFLAENEQQLPEALELLKIHFMSPNLPGIGGIDPFKDCETIMALARGSSNREGIVAERIREKFSEELLQELANMVSGSTVGVNSLFEMFLRAGRVVSRRQFELKLLQVAEKRKDGTALRSTWTIREPYRYLLTTSNEQSNLDSMMEVCKEIVGDQDHCPRDDTLPQ